MYDGGHRALDRGKFVIHGWLVINKKKKKKYGRMIFPFENVSHAPVLNFQDGVYVCYILESLVGSLATRFVQPVLKVLTSRHAFINIVF